MGSGRALGDLPFQTSSPSHAFTGATRMRYLMILLATLVAVLLYLDRICISTAGASVAKDLGITRDQLNHLLGAFFWSYALGQLPAGWLGDRYGARWMLGLFIVLWSLSTGLLGFATTLAGVWWLRMSCGLFEAVLIHWRPALCGGGFHYIHAGWRVH